MFAVAAQPRVFVRRGLAVVSLGAGRGDAGGATWMFRGRVAAPPRPRRGYSVGGGSSETGDFDAPSKPGGAAVALLVYDISRRQTFQNCKTWLSEARACGNPQMVVILVANKANFRAGTDRRGAFQMHSCAAWSGRVPEDPVENSAKFGVIHGTA